MRQAPTAMSTMVNGSSAVGSSAVGTSHSSNSAGCPLNRKKHRCCYIAVATLLTCYVAFTTYAGTQEPPQLDVTVHAAAAPAPSEAAGETRLKITDSPTSIATRRSAADLRWTRAQLSLADRFAKLEAHDKCIALVRSNCEAANARKRSTAVEACVSIQAMIKCHTERSSL